MKARNLIIALVLVAAGVVAYLKFKPKDADDRQKQSASMFAPAQRRSLELMAEAAGLVEPIRTVEVKSRASGEVLQVPVDTGDRVDAGTLLAEIDARDVQNALAQAQADVEAARVQRDTAEANRARMVSLRQSGVVTQQEFESAVQSAATARAAVVRAETNLQLAREKRGDVIIKAPISGTVLVRSVQPGVIIASATSNVSGGTTLFTMADLSEIQVRAKVDETDVGKIAPGQPASVTVEAYPNRRFTGTVFKIEPQAVIEQNVTMFPVLVRLGNPAGLLRPGMNAEIRVEISKKTDVLAVPNSAIVAFKDARTVANMLGVEMPDWKRSADAGFRRPSEAGIEAESRPGLVFVQNGGALEPRRVVLGMSDLDHTEIIDGLAEGEQVVLVSVAQIQAEQKKRNERMRQGTGGGILPGSGSGTGGRGNRGG